jgi:ATP adenylyltransferase
MSNGFVNPDNSKRGEYAKVIDEIAREKICPFCPEHVHRIHPKPIEEKKYWLVTDNAYPYKPVKQHLLLIHKEHIEHVTQLSSEAWEELRTILSELSKEKNIEGGALMMRFGVTKYTGASVTHLHAQLIQGNPDDPEYDKEKGVICRVG